MDTKTIEDRLVNDAVRAIGVPVSLEQLESFIAEYTVRLQVAVDGKDLPRERVWLRVLDYLGELSTRLFPAPVEDTVPVDDTELELRNYVAEVQ